MENLDKQQFYVSSFMIQKIFDELKNRQNLMRLTLLEQIQTFGD